MAFRKKKASPESRDESSPDSWLQIMSADGAIDYVRECIDAGDDINDPYPGGTALMHACSQGSAEVACFLLEAGADINCTKGAWKTTALACSCEAKYDFRLAHTLLKAGANPNIAEDEANLPLRIATRIFYLELLQLLLSYGADATHIDKDGNSLIHHALFEPEDRLLYAAIHHPSEHERINFIEELMYAGADIDAINKDGRTPLDLAYESNFKRIARYLEELCAQCNTYHSQHPLSHSPSL